MDADSIYAQVSAIYAGLGPEGRAWVDREWIMYRGDELRSENVPAGKETPDSGKTLQERPSNDGGNPVAPKRTNEVFVDDEARSLTDWILTYLENECALDPGCISDADRKTVENAVLNHLTGCVPTDLLAAGKELLEHKGIHAIRVKSQGSDLIGRDEVFRRIIERKAALATGSIVPASAVAEMRERCAKWHDEQAADHAKFRAELNRYSDVPDERTAWRHRKDREDFHGYCAAHIRQLDLSSPVRTALSAETNRDGSEG